MTAPTMSLSSFDPPRRRRRRRSVSLSLALVALAAAAAGAWLLFAGTRADAVPSLSGQVVGDTLFVYGSGGDDTIVLRLHSGGPTTLDVDFGGDGSADLSFDRTTFTAIQVHALGGADTVRVDEVNGVFTDTEATTLDGGAGTDTVLGGSSSEVLIGNGGADIVDGNRGNDLVFLGGGSDTAVWDPGDGSDTIEGQSGKDTLQFNGANISENIDVSANGTRVRFTRDVGAVTMDLGELETVRFNALGGADRVTVDDLSGTSARSVAVNLAASGGGGDGQADQVIANGTAAADLIEVVAETPAAVVKGLPVETSVTGGEPALDQLVVNGQAGMDSIEASPALGTSINAVLDGGADLDAVLTEGTNGNDVFQVVANGALAEVTDGGTAFFSIAAGGAESVRINAKGGDDTLTAGNGLAALIPLLGLDGGGGNDIIQGGDGADVIVGGGGTDFVDGNRGNDVEFLGGGADTVQWDPGDGSDTIEGEDGKDTLRFNGANISENIDVSANGTRARLFRDVANITMDLDGVETVQVNTLGGADNVTVHDLAGTSVRAVNVDLTSFGAGDGQPDQVIVEGTAGADALEASGAAPAATVKGLAAVPSVTGAEPTLDKMVVDPAGGNDVVEVDPGAALAAVVMADSADVDTVFTNGTGADDLFSITPGLLGARVTDGLGQYFEVGPVETLRVNGSGGNDTIVGANGLAALVPSLVLDGGSGNDSISGGDGADLILAGGGSDVVDPNRGNDVAFLGGGNDTVVWDPGDGSDTVEGEDGLDALAFNGANISENIDLSANGARVRFTRDVGAVTMDLAGVETIGYNALGGADNVTVHDLTGTAARTVDVNLQASGGGGDGQADQVSVEGTAGIDDIAVSGAGTAATVKGLAATVHVTNAEYANDRLNIDTQAGADLVDFSGLAPGVIQLWLDGSQVV